jgi:cellulose biosynthesis protein BcsQ
MMLSITSSGIDLPNLSLPYRLAVASHKGGTGRTTTACSIAWLWGQNGLKVLLVDACRTKAASMVAVSARGECPWKNVVITDTMPDYTSYEIQEYDVVIVDCPPLTEPEAQEVLHVTDGILLTCLADVLCLRTLPNSTEAIRLARQHNNKLKVLGILLTHYDDEDESQERTMAKLQESQMALTFDPPVPMQPEIREWPLRPGSDLPPGDARAAYAKLTFEMKQKIGIGKARTLVVA